MIAWQVLDGGLLTTVQDLGRRGTRRFGLPRSGAADSLSLQVANALVGNEPGTAALECTALGPRLMALRTLLVAIAGADCQARLDGRLLNETGSFFVAAGQVLDIGTIGPGFRCYVAISGGIDVPEVLGSRSTYLRARLGGFQGRPLRSGDPLCTFPTPARRPRRLPMRPLQESETLRVIVGPQDDHFTTLAPLFEQQFQVTTDSDRMGCRLTGRTPLDHAQGADIVSDGVPEGSLQVPGEGQPIIILADGQPTGGYAKPAVIIASDLERAAQLAPGDSVGFTSIDLAAAYAAYQRQQEYLRRCREQKEVMAAFYAVRGFGRIYQVRIEDTES